MSSESEEKIAMLYKAVFGNGMTGLCKKVEDIDDYVQQIKGALSFIKWLMGFLGIGNIALIITLLASAK